MNRFSDFGSPTYLMKMDSNHILELSLVFGGQLLLNMLFPNKSHHTFENLVLLGIVYFIAIIGLITERIKK